MAEKCWEHYRSCPYNDDGWYCLHHGDVCDTWDYMQRIKDGKNEIEQVTTMSIGEKLREERIRQGVSVRKMAELANTTPATVQNVERNAHSPSVEIVQRMAGALGCRLTIEREA